MELNDIFGSSETPNEEDGKPKAVFDPPVMNETKKKVHADRIAKNKAASKDKWIERGKYLLNPIAQTKDMLETSEDMLRIASKPASMWLADDLHASQTAISDFIKGGLKEGFSKDDLLTGWRRGQDEHDIMDRFARERLQENAGEIGGRIQAGVAEMLGSGFGAPGALAKAYTTTRYAPTGIKGALRSIGREGWMSGAEGVVEAFNEGQRNPAVIAMNGGIGMLAGAGGQMILGELAPRALKYGLQPDTLAKERVSDRLLGTGVGRSQRAADIRANYDDAIAMDRNPLLQEQNLEKRAQTVQRLGDSIAEATFPEGKGATAGATQEMTDRYFQTVKAVDDIIEQTNTRINNRFDTALDERRSSWGRKQVQDRQTKTYKKIYDSLEDTSSPEALGSIQRNFHETTDSVGERFAKLAHKGDVTHAKNSKLYNQVVRDLQPKEVNPHAKTVKVKEHGDAIYDEAGEKIGEVDLATENTYVGDLMNARKKLSAQLQPGGTIGGTTVNSQMITEGRHLLKALDDEIASIVGDTHGQAAKGFGKYMGMREAEAMGIEFYDHKLLEDPQYGRDLTEYMKMLEKDPDALDAFRYGYRQAMRQDISDRNAVTVMNELVGDVMDKSGKVDLTDISKVKSTGIENLRKVLGDQEADSLIREFTLENELKNQEQALRFYLQGKEFDQSAIDGIVRDGDQTIMFAAATPGQQALTSTGAISALGRRLQALGVKDSQYLLDLTGKTGKEGVDFIESILQAGERASNAPGMGVATAGAAVTNQGDTTMEDRQAIRGAVGLDHGGTASILEYLQGKGQ